MRLLRRHWWRADEVPDATAANLFRTSGKLLIDRARRALVVSFDQLTLGEVAAEFDRYNPVQLVVEVDSSGGRLSGNLDAHNIDRFARLAHEEFGL